MKPLVCIYCGKPVEASPCTEPYTKEIWAWQYICISEEKRITVSLTGNIIVELLDFELLEF